MSGHVPLRDAFEFKVLRVSQGYSGLVSDIQGYSGLVRISQGYSGLVRDVQG